MSTHIEAMKQEPCVFSENPSGCYRIRCQLGGKCVDDDMSFRASPPPRQPEQAQPVAWNEPLPCPFCGHIGLDFSEGSTYRWGQATCGGCGATCGEVRREYPDKGEWHSEAITEWNRRTSPPPSQPWVGLTDDEMRQMCGSVPSMREAVREAEDKLKEKNA